MSPMLCRQLGQISFLEEDLLLRQSSWRFWSRRGCCWAWLKKCPSFRCLPQTRLKSFANHLKATHCLFDVDLVHPVQSVLRSGQDICHNSHSLLAVAQLVDVCLQVKGAPLVCR